jgi:hypothetical protein
VSRYSEFSSSADKLEVERVPDSANRSLESVSMLEIVFRPMEVQNVRANRLAVATEWKKSIILG